ncbi:hypothetical protein R3W88_012034 [Solanum pinnatisectum]|uniref:Uncharacterized protein n=1 Tax=Solanum pinnatisectum TaxID=50273 RepID=A0AAV9L891_9SOLN|nr:hypothetical protein R3W88_012034 [Solanum pinnatisectum]
MLEAVGHDFMEKFFTCCESTLAEDGLLVLQIRALGFNDKFIRTWEYYFDYYAAGFKTCTLGDYQIVFSRPGNVAAFGDPYNVVPSTY